MLISTSKDATVPSAGCPYPGPRLLPSPPSRVPLRKVTFRLRSEDVASMRFALSPLRECLGAFRAWMDPTRQCVLPPWMVHIQPELLRIDWEPLKSLILLSRGALPDFLLPPLNLPSPELGEELENLRVTPECFMRLSMENTYPHGLAPSLLPAMASPQRFLAQVTALIDMFWTRALAPGWNVLRSKLEGEVLYRARVWAMEGVDGLFRGLHRDIEYAEGSLTIQAERQCSDERRPAGLVLVPSMFSWPDIFLTTPPQGQLTITYVSRAFRFMEWGALPNGQGTRSVGWQFISQSPDVPAMPTHNNRNCRRAQAFQCSSVRADNQTLAVGSARTYAYWKVCILRPQCDGEIVIDRLRRL